MSSKSDMKGYYKQKKSSGGRTKSNPKSSVSSTKKSSLTTKNTATYGSDIAQPPALVAHGSPDLKVDDDIWVFMMGTDDYDSKEEVLRQFDMNMKYGPCIGMTRLARWERAKSLGLNPPKDVEDLLKSGKAEAECLWDGRV